MQIEARTITNRRYRLNCAPSDTVLTLKERISEEAGGLPLHRFRVILSGRCLDDDRTLDDYTNARDLSVFIVMRNGSARYPDPGSFYTYMLAGHDLPPNGAAARGLRPTFTLRFHGECPRSADHPWWEGTPRQCSSGAAMVAQLCKGKEEQCAHGLAFFVRLKEGAGPASAHMADFGDLGCEVDSAPYLAALGRSRPTFSAYSSYGAKDTWRAYTDEPPVRAELSAPSPLELRLTPSAPLSPGARYAVVLHNVGSLGPCGSCDYVVHEDKILPFWTPLADGSAPPVAAESADSGDSEGAAAYAPSG
jgi:hypothetical protein